MLSRADRELARRDEALPGLATLLDSDAFASALAAELPHCGIHSAELTYLRYKPGVNCVAAYKVHARDLKGEVTSEVYAKTYGKDVDQKLGKMLQRPCASNPLGVSRLALDSIAAEVCVFPNDNKLETLARLEDPAELMASVLSESDLSDAWVETLAYKPERRYVGRLMTPSGPAAALKFFESRHFEAASDKAKRLHSSETLRFPERIGRSSRHAVVAFEWLEGVGLRDAVRDSGTLVGLSRVGAALAELHELRDSRFPVRERGQELEILGSLVETLGFLCPSLAARVQRLGRRIEDALPPAAEEPPHLIHGDFYDKQVLIGPDDVRIVDLDRGGRGLAAGDVGMFLAHLERDSVFGEVDASRAVEVGAEFVEGYLERAKALPIGLEAYVAFGLLQLGPDAFRRHVPDWPERTEALIVRAENALTRLALP